MKFPLFFLFSLFCVNSFAQNCSSHILFQKGAQLEYNLYTAQLQGPELKTSRLLFEVTDVKEMDGRAYSKIIKKGFGILDEKDHYERQIELECDGKNLLIPFDFYSADTIYFKDMYPKLGKKRGGYAFAYTPLEDIISFVFPLVMEGVSKIPEGEDQIVQKGKMRYMSGSGGIAKSDFEFSIKIKSVRLIGMETVKTEAGSFECYKLYFDCDLKDFRNPAGLKFWLYFNTKVGLVKYDGPGGTVELVSVKK